MNFQKAVRRRVMSQSTGDLPEELFMLIGKRIQDIDLRPFDDGRGGSAYDPVIILGDGTRIVFHVQETEVGQYGVEFLVVAAKREE